MKYVKLPEDKQHKLPFYLAMEEYLAEHCGEDLLFTWQVEPTVIFGRNQVMLAEVNVDYCEQHHIQYYRRKSGGGCVYADKGNIMVSEIKTLVTFFGGTGDLAKRKLYPSVFNLYKKGYLQEHFAIEVL